MVGFIGLHRHLRVRGGECIDRVHGNPVVFLAEVGQYGAGRLARRLFGACHAAPVVANRCAQTLEQTSRAPAQQAAPAIADDADLAATGLAGVVDRRLNILQNARCR